MGKLTGGVFLVGFALALGANEFVIGLIGAIPALLNLAQLPASYFVERSGSLKTIVIKSAASGRLLWLLVALIPLLYPFVSKIFILVFFLSLISIFNILAGITRLAWLAWTAVLVPKEIMGRYFAKRNIYMNGLAMLVGIGAGALLDQYKEWFPSKEIFGFSGLFIIGSICGMISVFYLNKMSEPKVKRNYSKESFWKTLRIPIKEKNFRKLIFFSLSWNFSVNLIMPFLNVYMLDQMKLNYSFITTLGAIGGVFSLVSLKYWGKLSDRFGNKPVLIISAVGKCIYPFLWLFTTRDSYALFIVINMTGFLDAGLGLTLFNTLLKLAPEEKNSVYLAVYATVVGLITMLAPICGGILINSLKSSSLELSFLTLSNFKLLFLTSGILRLASLFLLKDINEPDAKNISYLFSVLRKRGLFRFPGEV